MVVFNNITALYNSEVLLLQAAKRELQWFTAYTLLYNWQLWIKIQQAQIKKKKK
jgi:hypothetical protein